ncbi:hypothetical protein QEN19_002323 [Hanseniaspora menglaensis]
MAPQDKSKADTSAQSSEGPADVFGETNVSAVPPRPLLNKVGSSGHNIYSNTVVKSSEKTLYGSIPESNNFSKKNGSLTSQLRVNSNVSEGYGSRSSSLKQFDGSEIDLKKDVFMKQMNTMSTPMNQKPPAGILNHSSTPIRSRASTINTSGDGNVSFVDDSGLKTPVSAIQFQFEDKVPLRRLPHQHRGSMTPRINNITSASDLTNEIKSDTSTGPSVTRTRTNSQSKKHLMTPSSVKQSSSNSSSAATSAVGSGSSFLSVSINDIVAQLTGKVHSKQIKKDSIVKIPGGFGEDDEDSEAEQNDIISVDTPRTSGEASNSKRVFSQLTSIDNLINRSPRSTSPSLKDGGDIEYKTTKQRIFEFLPKQDDGKYHILLGATGSVASIKIPLIVNKLFKYYTPEQCSIQVILTNSSMKFIKGLKISPLVRIWTDEDLNYLSQQPYKLGDPILQVELRRWADIFVVAPLSANTLAKISNGISDNLLTNVIRGWPAASTPLYLAPAMNTFMYIHPLTKIHLTTIKELYSTAEILKPVEKVLVCGDIGMGGMREWTDICAVVIAKLDKMNKDDGANKTEDEEEEDDDNESLIDRNETDDEDHSEDDISSDKEGDD